MPVTAAEAEQLRHHLGMDQEVFARLLGVDLRTVQRWEQGLSGPQGAAEAVLLAFREALHVSLDPAPVLDFLRRAGELGLAYVIVKLLDSYTTHQKAIRAAEKT